MTDLIELVADATASGGGHLAYGQALRRELVGWRDRRGGRGDVRIAILTQRGNLTFVRVLFCAEGASGVALAESDPEWPVCRRWLEEISARTRMPVVPGRIVVSGDLCVVVKDTHAPDAEEAGHDARAIVEAILESLSPGTAAAH